MVDVMAGSVSKAVIPAAGRGMRMRPLSRFLPKEMFPLGKKPMIQLAVEEAFGAGVSEVCIVIRKGKETIREYLLMEREKRNQATELIRPCKMTFVYQKRWDGLGGALAEAKAFVGREPFLMIIPDQFLSLNYPSASEQLLRYYAFNEPVVLSSMVKVRKKDAQFFYGSRGFQIKAKKLPYRHLFPVRRVQLGATVRHSSYEIRGFGRTVFPEGIFPYLIPRFANIKTGEIDLWKTFKAFSGKIPHYACLLRGVACDLGTLPGYNRFLPFFCGEDG